MSKLIPISAKTCDELYSSLLQCHAVAELLIVYSLNSACNSREMDCMSSTLELLKTKLYSMAESIDPGVLAKNDVVTVVRYEQ